MTDYHLAANFRAGEGQRHQDSIVVIKPVSPGLSDVEKRTLTPAIMDLSEQEKAEIEDHLRSYVNDHPEPNKTDYFVPCEAPAAGLASGVTEVTLVNVPPGTSVVQYDEVFIHDGVEKPYLIMAAASESGGEITLTLRTGLVEPIEEHMPCMIFPADAYRAAKETWQKADYDWVQYEFQIPLLGATGFSTDEMERIRDQRILVEPVRINYNKVKSWKP